jgi:hypothetical protein
MSLSKDRRLERKDGVEQGFPVKTGSTIYGGALVATDATGYLVRGSDTAALIFQGVAMERQDNALGQNGDLTCIVRRRGLIACLIAAATQADVGKNVFLADDQTVALTASSTNKIFCGVIAGIIDGTTVWVDIEPAVKQADVATHIADTAAAHAASAISLADAGAHFATDDAESALQALGKTVAITIPRFTGWTKDGADKTIAIPPLKLPVQVKVKRAYVNLGTAPGAGKTLALKLNTSALLSITGTDTQGNTAALAITIAADTEFAITAAETAAGAGANCDIILVAELAGA